MIGTLAFVAVLHAGAAGAVAPAEIQDARSGLDVRDVAGRRITAEGLRGRVVLVDFWATWCAPCIEEMPRLVRLYERRAGNGLEILGVRLDAMDHHAFRSWLLREQLPWPQVHDGRGFDGAVARAFGLKAIPASLVVDREGRVVGRDLRGPALEDLLERLLGR